MKDQALPVDAPCLALRKSAAAAAIGVSDEVFDSRVRPSLPVVRLGSVRIYPVDLLAEWLRAQASAPTDDLAASRDTTGSPRN